MNETVALLVEQRAEKDWYTTAELARLLNKAEFTVREWCRLGRVDADKRPCGRGRSQEWIVSHDELTRIRNDGLLPANDIIRSRERIGRQGCHRLAQH